MTGHMIGFIGWAIGGLFLVGLGIYSFFSSKAVGFWANVEMGEVHDVKKYNRAVGKLWVIYGIIFLVLGLPLLKPQNSPLVLLSILGVVFETIAIMAIYQLVIVPRYQKSR